MYPKLILIAVFAGLGLFACSHLPTPADIGSHKLISVPALTKLVEKVPTLAVDLPQVVLPSFAGSGRQAKSGKSHPATSGQAYIPQGTDSNVTLASAYPDLQQENNDEAR